MTSAAPWISHYDAGVPPSLAPYPKRTVLDYLASHATAHPHAPALLYKGATVTWAELQRSCDAFASALAEMGIAKGDRVALLLPNCPQFVVAQCAAWALGAIVAPLNPTYAEREIEESLRQHEVGTIVTLTRFYRRVKNVQARTPVTRVIATNIKDYFPPLLRTLFTLLREKRDGDRVTLARGDHDLSALLRQHAGRTPPITLLSPEDPAVILLSGGTTGTPKGALGRHSAYVYTGVQAQAWTAPVLHGSRDPILVPLPLFHVYANVGIQGMAFVNGNPIALVPNPRDIADLLKTVRRVKPIFFNGVPSLYIALLNHPLVQKGRVDFKSIKVCFSGASALMADTKLRFEAITGGRIVEGYSLTEAMMGLCVNPVAGPNKLGSVGMPLPDVFVRIFDANEGLRPLPAGEVGEIAISALQLMTGFWDRDEETASVLRDHADEQGTRRWLHTGDLGYLDDDGYLFIVDRKKDLIKTSGFQVWPREIEEVLASHPSIAEVGAIGIADSVKGEVVKACVVLRAGCSATESELRDFCRGRLAPYKIPARVEFRSELPKTMVGKVLRRALRERHS